MKEILITESDSNRRLDKFLMKYFNTAPNSLIYKLLRKKRIKLNGKKADGSEILIDGDVLNFYLSDETLDNFMESRIIKESGKLEVVYEDSNILIANKPAGLLSHSENSVGDDTLIDRLLYHLYMNKEYVPVKESSFTPAICNRLDRNTSGIVICGKNLASVQYLNKIITDNLVDKYYLAIVAGEVKVPGVLRGYHVKDKTNNTVGISEVRSEESKEAITEYYPLKSAGGISLLRIKLITGRSHQIRAHLSSINHPIVGDTKYGSNEINCFFKDKYRINSQLLHAEKIVFNQMNEPKFNYLSNRAFCCEPPKPFRTILYF